ncbi:MAG: FAD-dependent oxidoreductase [Gemmatimonadetes bacterium]|nr:FAD-dependent oxidoreductase [Gemmatimonadota bacterium]MYE18070.1 FAD-dependent oxidoreductase [Gemmatimonadota bacterium]
MRLRRLWRPAPVRRRYDVVIIGGGIHGLATAYYLARTHGIRDVAVLESHYIGFGGSGRNTAIVRANQRTAENVRLYDEGLKLWRTLTDELDFNLMFFNCGTLMLGHSEAAVDGYRMLASTHNVLGVKSEVLNPRQCAELIPELDISDRPAFPIQAGLYHPPGGVVRHDAVVWGLAKGAAAHGVHIHQGCEVQGIDTDGNRVTGVRTSLGTIRCNRLGIMAGGYSTAVAAMLGIELPIHPLTIQAMVTHPLKPFLHHVFSSGAYHVYANQTLKGEIATGAHMDSQVNYTNDATAYYLKHQAEALVDLMPVLRGVRFMRIWAGLADMTPDMAPIMEGHLGYDHLYLDAGWGYFGFKSGPVAGKYMADYMATGERPEILEAFQLKRFLEGRYSGETAAVMKYGHWD